MAQRKLHTQDQLAFLVERSLREALSNLTFAATMAEDLTRTRSRKAQKAVIDQVVADCLRKLQTIHSKAGSK